MGRIIGWMAVLVLLSGCSLGQPEEVSSEEEKDIVTMEAYLSLANDLNDLQNEMTEIKTVMDQLQTVNNTLLNDSQTAKEQIEQIQDRLVYLMTLASEAEINAELQNGITELEISLNNLRQEFDAALDAEALSVPQVTVKVASVEGFLNAIGSNRHIILAEGDYNLTGIAANNIISDQIIFTEVYDGVQIDIHGVRNMTIEGAGLDKTVIMVEPRYAEVLRFVNSSDLAFENLTMGHTVTDAYCTGGVVGFSNVKNANFDGVRLYGCGTYGIVGDGLIDLSFDDGIIDGCSYGIMDISNAKNLIFEDSRFADNREYSLVNIGSSRDVSFTRCNFTGNVAESDTFFNVYATVNMTVANCTFSDNQVGYFVTKTDSVLFSDNEIVDGQYQVYAEYGD